MMVLGDDVFCIGFKSAVHKFVIIRVCCNQTKMVVNLNHLGVGQIKQGLDDIGSNLRANFLGKYLFVLSQNFIGDAKNVYVWYLPQITNCEFHPNILIDGEIEDRIGLEWSQAHHYVWNDETNEYDYRKPECKVSQLASPIVTEIPDWDAFEELKKNNEYKMLN